MKVLYLTNIHNPYRDEFLEQLGRECELTVLFEQRSDSDRDGSWFEGAKARSYQEVFLPEGEKGPVSRTMLRLVSLDWDLVVVGCYNSPKQMFAIEVMRVKRVPYAVNLDGPLFSRGSKRKGIVRKHVLKGANAYLVAGHTSVESVRDEVGSEAKIIPYSFTSLTKAQLTDLTAVREVRDENLILCVGQFLPYKGIDALLDAFAGMEYVALRLRVIGAGRRNAELQKAVEERGLSDRVETVAFMPPEELAREYSRAGLLVLPSRQECWGLVVNEAAACGCPIVSTWGSGAAVEFLSEDYPEFLAEPGNHDSLARAIASELGLGSSEREAYGTWLAGKSSCYSIEKTVEEHMRAFSGACSSNPGSAE